MNRKLASGAAAALFALYAVAAHAVLKVGDAAPDISAQASHGGKTYTDSLAAALQDGARARVPRAAVARIAALDRVGIRGIDRHERRAGLHDREHRDHRVDRARQAEQDPVARPHAAVDETSGQVVRASFELAVREARVAARERERFGRKAGLRSEQTIDAG